MNESLKVVERMIQSVQEEIKLASQDNSISTKSYNLLKEALVDAINLKSKVEDARCWNRSTPA